MDLTLVISLLLIEFGSSKFYQISKASGTFELPEQELMTLVSVLLCFVSFKES